ncbi:MAG: hypothetical protein HIU57_05170 [Acidobacteria bacterium]|nr:hypothetical protein [Acidobacteriota bacterium]
MIAGPRAGSVVVVDLLGAPARRRRTIWRVTTSQASCDMGGCLGRDVRPLAGIHHLGVVIDGSGQVDPTGWMTEDIGAQTEQKVVAVATRYIVIVSKVLIGPGP